jgi:hypothetical protein
MFDAYVKARVASMQKINAHEAARGTQPSSTHGINAKWGGGVQGVRFFLQIISCFPESATKICLATLQ